MDHQVVIYQDAAKEWRWRRTAGNNRIVADSGEGYDNRQDAMDMAFHVNAGPYTIELHGVVIRVNESGRVSPAVPA